MKRLTLALSVSAAIATAAAPSRACVCNDANYLNQLPESGAMNVPQNTKLWLRPNLTPEFAALLDADGQQIESTWTPAAESGIGVTIVAPVAPLAPQATYQVRRYLIPVSEVAASGPQALLAEGTEITMFSTGTFVDDEAPSAPSATIFSVEASWTAGTSDCDDVSGVRAGVTFAVEHDGDFFVATLRDSPPLDLSETGAAARVSDGVRFGTGSCTAGWSTAEPSASASFYFASVDAAGNVSAWTGPIVVQLPDSPRPVSDAGPTTDEGEEQRRSGGCSSISMGGIESLPAALLFAKCLARRRDRTRGKTR